MRVFHLMNADASVKKTIHELIFSSISPCNESRRRHVHRGCTKTEGRRNDIVAAVGGVKNEAERSVLKLDEEEEDDEPRRGGAGAKE